MRLFFGLPLEPEAAMDIAGWRERMLPPLERPVPAENFHITLTFLGEIAPERCDRLIQEADDIASQPFTLPVDEVGFFPKPGILWIGPTTPPAALRKLARSTSTSAGRAGIQTAKRDFRPHITLARRCRVPPPASAAPPAFDLRFHEFILFESVSGRSSVRYEPVARWRL